MPLHDGSKKNGPVVFCSCREHTLAHYYRYLAYGQKGDFVAFTMRWNQKVGSYERALLSVEVNRKQKNTFWNSQWQSLQGKKGGIKEGSVNRFKQYKARQKVGLCYGFALNTENQKKARQRGGLKNSIKQKIGRSKGGILKQRPKLKKFLSKKKVWEHKKKGKTVKIIVPPQESVVKILNLKKKIPNLNHCKNAYMNICNIINGQKCLLKNRQLKKTLSIFFILL